jgi:hypothetical protein
MLPSIEAALRSQGIQTYRAPAGSAIEQLGISLAADRQQRARQLWITPLPGLEEQLAEGLSLLQFLVELPFKSVQPAEADLAGLLLALNNLLPLGAFGWRQADEVILYRCVLVLGPDATSNSQVALETVLLTSYLVDQFSGLIESVALGRKTLAQALRELPGADGATKVN